MDNRRWLIQINLIDHRVYVELENEGIMKRPPPTHVVRRILKMLERQGYVEHFEDANPLLDRYEPKRKLFELRDEIWRLRSLRKDSEESATH